MPLTDLKGETADPNVNRSTGAMPGQHNIAGDKSKRLEDFHKQNQQDTHVSRTDTAENIPPEEMSEVDIAWQVLSESGKENPLYFKDLILEVIARKNKIAQNEASIISEIYTMINMDSRFQHIGNGLWGLTDWYPTETKRTRSSTSKTAKAASSEL